jgi:Uma2 family endonuclease
VRCAWGDSTARIGLVTAATTPHLMSLAQWRALGEDTDGRSELQEGVLIVSPRPVKAHSRAVRNLLLILQAQRPDGLEALSDVDVVVDRVTPATVRVPDVVVVPVDAPEQLSAEDVVIAIEVLSPGTRRVDRVTKRSEYSEAGIRHYWIVDLGSHRLTELTLVGDEYRPAEHSGTFATTAPFDVRIDLTQLDR